MSGQTVRVTGRARRFKDTRHKVLDAAAALLSEGGSERFTIEAVAGRTGIARTTIYRHWPNRGALLEAVGGSADAGSASKTAVLESAASLLAERGAAAFTVEAVIEHSGIARSTIYRHWPSRTELLRSVVTHLTGAPAKTPDTGTLHGDLLAYFVSSVRRLEHDQFDSRLRSLPSLLEIAKGDPELRIVGVEIRNAIVAPLLPMLERARQRGEIRKDVELPLAGQILYLSAFMPFTLGEETSEAYIRQVLNVVLDGIRSDRKGVQPKSPEGRVRKRGGRTSAKTR